ncbi:MAG: carbohydrate-binding protein [Opitutales bacterium]
MDWRLSVRSLSASRLRVLRWLFLLLLPSMLQGADTPVSYGLGGYAYYDAPRFGNFLWNESRNWRDQATNQTIHRFNPDGSDNAQINSLGFPTFLNSGQVLVAKPGQNAVPQTRQLFEGQFVLEWQGAADIRVVGHSFVASKSNTGSTGVKNNGRRVYKVNTSNANGVEVQIHALGGSQLTGIQLWMPDPSDPQNKSLEDKTFHPAFLDLIADRNWRALRFMDWGKTNASPQRNWSDRRRPADCFASGIINRRSPAEGLVWYVNGAGQNVYFAGDRRTGIAYEHMIALCNQTARDMWVCVPHLATDDYINKLCNLIAYGSDGSTPYTSPQANPVYPPLNANRKVYFEFSNEIWSNGGNFPQGNWAQDQANQQGISKPQFNARQFSKIWNRLEARIGASRVIRTAAIWTGSENYTRAFIDEFYNNSSLLKPENISPTTYYGQGIQFWVHDNFPNLPGSPNDPYWSSAQFAADKQATFDQWNFFVLSGTKYGNAGNTGPDNIGNFPAYVTDVAQERNLDMIAYEGGPSLYTDALDVGGSADDGITTFVMDLNREPRFADIYDIVLNQSFERGLKAHSLFTDVSKWGKFGQWGHNEYLGQDLNTSVKWQLIRQAFDEHNSFTHIFDTPQGSRPSFSTPAVLPGVEVGNSVNQTIAISGGNGTRTVDLIGKSLVDGLSFNLNQLRLSGTPTESGSSFVYLRVHDSDGDVNWRNFSLLSIQRSAYPKKTIDFENQTVSTHGVGEPEPMTFGAYAFTSNNGSSLYINAPSGGPWPAGWPSKVLHGRNWGTSLYLARTDGNPFDLTEFDAGTNAGESLELTVTYADGSSEIAIYDLPKQVGLTLIEPDFVGIVEARFQFKQNSGGQGDNRYGAIDNVVLNGIAPGGGGSGGGGSNEGPRYQAENATVTGAQVKTGGNANGGSYVDFQSAGDRIEFTSVDMASAGNVTVTMRYANGRQWGSGTDVYVNGSFAKTVYDSPTGSWTTWQNKTFSLNLSAGTNVIRLQARYSHSPNIDYLDVPGGS